MKTGNGSLRSHSLAVARDAASGRWTLGREDLSAGAAELLRIQHPLLPDFRSARLSIDGLELAPAAHVPARMGTDVPAGERAAYLCRLLGLLGFLRTHGLGISTEGVLALGADPRVPSRPALGSPPVPGWRSVPPCLAAAAAALRFGGVELEADDVGSLSAAVLRGLSRRGSRVPEASAALAAHDAARSPEALLAELAARGNVGPAVGPDLLGLVYPRAEPAPTRPGSAVALGRHALFVARGSVRRREALEFVEVTAATRLADGSTLRRIATALGDDPRAELLRVAAGGEVPSRLSPGPPVAVLVRGEDGWDSRSRRTWDGDLLPALGLARVETAAGPRAPWDRGEMLRVPLDAAAISALFYLPFGSLTRAIASWERLSREASGDLGKLLTTLRACVESFDPAHARLPRPARRRAPIARDPVLAAAALLADGFSSEEVAAAAGCEAIAASHVLEAALEAGVLVSLGVDSFSFADEPARSSAAARVGTAARNEIVERLRAARVNASRLVVASLARGTAADVEAAKAELLALAGAGALEAARALLLRAPPSSPDLGHPLVAIRVMSETGDGPAVRAAAARLAPNAVDASHAERVEAARCLVRHAEVEKALALVPERPGDAAASLARARVLLQAQREADAAALLESPTLEAPLGDVQEAERELLLADLASRRQDFASAAKRLKRLRGRLERLPKELLYDLNSTAGCVASDLGRPAEARAFFRAARDAVSDPGRRADAALDMAVVSEHAGDLAEAERELGEALDLYESAGLEARYLSALGNRADVALLMGDVPSARADLARVVAHDSARGREYQLLFSAGTRQRLALLDADLDDAARVFRESSALGVFARHPAQREVLVLEAGRLLAAREPQEALARLEEAGALPDNRQRNEPLRRRLAASGCVDLSREAPSEGLDEAERTLLAAELALKSGSVPQAAAVKVLQDLARTPKGALEAVGRLVEWSFRFPDVLPEAARLLDLASQAAARWGLEGAAARFAGLELSRHRKTGGRHEARAGEWRSVTTIAEDKAMRSAMQLLDRVAPTGLSVLLSGETGTGKEVLAKELHARSRRRGPLVPVNMAALSATLVESELFGHARGAFTGADRDRLGLIEASSGGTLFLDEIGDLAMPLQAKLLRVLQEREVVRVGEIRARKVDLRVVSATHRDLDAMVASGDFRADLFHRLVQVKIDVPPLRERPRDVIALIARDLDGHELSGEARALLLAYGWPGNVRELLAALESARALSSPSERIEPCHLPAALRRGPAPAPSRRRYHDAIEETKRRSIRDALLACGGNRTRAARFLGLSRQSLLYDIKKLKIED